MFLNPEINCAKKNCIIVVLYKLIFLWRNSPTWAQAASLLSFLNHTLSHTTLGTTPLNEWSVRRRDLYLTTYYTLFTTDTQLYSRSLNGRLSKSTLLFSGMIQYCFIFRHRRGFRDIHFRVTKVSVSCRRVRGYRIVRLMVPVTWFCACETG